MRTLALLSRCEVFVLQALELDDLKKLVEQACQKDTTLAKKDIEITEWESLTKISGGDGRKLLNAL